MVSWLRDFQAHGEEDNGDKGQDGRKCSVYGNHEVKKNRKHQSQDMSFKGWPSVVQFFSQASPFTVPQLPKCLFTQPTDNLD